MHVSWSHDCRSTFAECNKITLFLFFLSQELVEALRSKGQGTHSDQDAISVSCHCSAPEENAMFLFGIIALVHLQNNKMEDMKYLIQESSI
jgi:hypothetical protein